MANIGVSLKFLESQVEQITKQLTSQPLGTVPKATDPNMREVNAVFIQHDEICMAEFQKKKDLEDLKNLHTNIQSADQEKVTLTEGENKGIQRKLPQKLQDPGEFVVPCAIGGQMMEKAICDSRASVNVMPSSLYEKLGLSWIKPTKLILQLSDKSVKVPLGFLEDVEVQIDKLRLPADFVVLDMENSQNIHVILGRPFLATVGAVIDVKRGKLTMEVEGQRVEIKASKRPHDPP
ncbi:uncharacterized protein LOC142529384 [Primulina tabacum]|uniref:uncharacterized protein LOC142529384 n=1 Tax=Primulina tabacum TaxID=48773 RepID=UPI003F591BD9